MGTMESSTIQYPLIVRGLGFAAATDSVGMESMSIAPAPPLLRTLFGDN